MIHLTWTLSLQSIESVLGTATYQNNKVNQWTSSIVEQCLNQLTKLGKPFKYIGTWMSLSSSGWHHWIILCRFSHNPFSVFSSSLCPLPYHLLSSLPRILRPFSRPYLSTLSFYLTGLLPPSLSATQCLLLIHTPVTSVIMQKNGAGLHTASSCYWDNSTDGECVTTSQKKPVNQWDMSKSVSLLPNQGNLMTIHYLRKWPFSLLAGSCTIRWENKTMYCIVTVFGLAI